MTDPVVDVAWLLSMLRPLHPAGLRPLSENCTEILRSESIGKSEMILLSFNQTSVYFAKQNCGLKTHTDVLSIPPHSGAEARPSDVPFPR